VGIWNEIRRIEDRIIAICFAVGRSVSDRQVASDDIERERGLVLELKLVLVLVLVLLMSKSLPISRSEGCLWLGRAEPLLDFDIGRGVSAIIDVLNVR
jgi:hypothetical protein